MVNIFKSAKTHIIISVVVRHRFDADRDPDRHQNDVNPQAYPNQSFTHFGKAEFFKIILFTAMPVFHFSSVS
jgi:hypothetical protein